LRMVHHQLSLPQARRRADDHDECRFRPLRDQNEWRSTPGAGLGDLRLTEPRLMSGWRAAVPGTGGGRRGYRGQERASVGSVVRQPSNAGAPSSATPQPLPDDPTFNSGAVHLGSEASRFREEPRTTAHCVGCGLPAQLDTTFGTRRRRPTCLSPTVATASRCLTAGPLKQPRHLRLCSTTPTSPPSSSLSPSLQLQVGEFALIMRTAVAWRVPRGASHARRGPRPHRAP
jgi:hypothetical protein